MIPDEPRALDNMGSSLWQLGDGHGAVDAYRRSIALDPASPEPHVNLGTAYYEYGDALSAAKEYAAALRLGGTQGLQVRIANDRGAGYTALAQRRLPEEHVD